VIEETVLPSEMVDAVLGKHPFSIAVYLYLVKEVRIVRVIGMLFYDIFAGVSLSESA
jgi:hypothetical protein